MFAIVLFIGLTWLLYKFGTRSYDYWEKKGLKYEKPLPFIGSILKVFAGKISAADYVTKVYNKYPEEKYVGAYAGHIKMMIIRDIELVKRVLVTDFQFFYPRGLNTHKTVIESMMKNLFFADGDLWRLLRQRMTQAFTSGKLKAMFPLIVEMTERLKNSAAAAAESGAEVDVRDLMARYTTDVIGACGFGIDTDSINDEESPFRKLGKRIFTLTPRDIICTALKWSAPELFKNLTTLPFEVEKTTLSLVTNILKDRNYKPSKRNDFIDLLLELKSKGTIVGESIEKKNPDGSPITVSLELDEVLMAAQVFVFFAAGFETSSSATSFTLHQLAFHPDAQRKCQQEIDEVLRRHDNQLCYDAVKEMKYLEMCFRETLRIFPSLGYVSRKCAAKYTFPETNLTIEEGVMVFIPIHAIHNDKQYYKDPDQFEPERFHPNNVNDIRKNAYLPFGSGPRICIGERLGVMQSLAGLAALLSQFTVRPSRSTLRKPVSEPTSFVVQNIAGGLPLSLTRRKFC